MNELHPSDERILAGIRRHLDGAEPLVPAAPAWQPAGAARGRAASGAFHVNARAGLGFGGLGVAVIVVAVLALALGPLGQRNGPAASASASRPGVLPGPTVTFELRLEPAGTYRDLAGDTDSTAAILDRRLGDYGVNGIVHIAAPGVLTVTVAAEVDTPELRSLFGVGVLAFVDMPASQYGTQGEPGTKPLPGAGESIDPALPAQFTGADLVRSKTLARSEPASGSWGVDFTFTPDATRRFAAYTAANVNHYFAIVLDGRVLSIPYIKSPIAGGQGIITLQGSRQALALAAILETGPLPAPLVETMPSPPSRAKPTASPLATGLGWIEGMTIDAGNPPDRLFGWSGGFLATADAHGTGGEVRIWYSPDGRTWDTAATYPVQSLSASVIVAARQGGVVALTTALDCEIDFGQCNPLGVSVKTSHDGRTWTDAGEATAFSGAKIRQVTADDARFLALGTTGTTGTTRGWTSEDGTAWTEVSLPEGATNVTGLRNGFVAVGSSSAAGSATLTPAAWYSADGRSWSGGPLPAASLRQPIGGLALHVTGQTATIAFLGGATGSDTAVWATQDGKTWRVVDSPHPFYCSDGRQAFAFATGPIVNGSSTLTGWASSDGVAWTKVLESSVVPDDALLEVPSWQGVQPTVACGAGSVIAVAGGAVWELTRS